MSILIVIKNVGASVASMGLMPTCVAKCGKKFGSQVMGHDAPAAGEPICPDCK